MALYPGGSRFDPGCTRFSFKGNFLCDLFFRTNPGRNWALTGTYSLAVALLIFWILLPGLFHKRATRHARLVRGFGAVTMLLTLLIATPLHDWCILVAVPLGVVAFVLSIQALDRNGQIILARLGAFSLALCVINYLSLITQVYPPMLPALQKVTLLGFLSWVLLAMERLTRSNAPAPRHLYRN
ncbi:MAG: hypothetical protein ACXWPM_10655 [Bdellovibrionota bacterium]